MKRGIYLSTKGGFYDNTLHYLEEYIGSFVARHRMEVRENTKLLQKVQTVLGGYDESRFPDSIFSERKNMIGKEWKCDR